MYLMIQFIVKARTQYLILDLTLITRQMRIIVRFVGYFALLH